MSGLPPQPMATMGSSSGIQVGSTTYIYRFVGPQNRECLVPEDQPDNTEFTFVRKLDPASGREFFVNVLTRNRIWSLPDVNALAAMPSLLNHIDRSGTIFQLSLSADGEKLYAPQHLPVPLQPGHCWMPRPDRIHQKYFFVNAATREKIMFLPPTMDHLDRIQQMYKHYGVEEVVRVPERWAGSASSASALPSASNHDSGDDASLTAYERSIILWAGRETQLLAQLVLKYGPEPPRAATVLEVVEAYVHSARINQDEVDAILRIVEDHSPQEQLEALREAFGPSPKTTRQRILSMYHHYAPDKLHQVDEVTNQFGAKHLLELLDNLVSKWGPEPESMLTSPRTANAKIEQRVVAMLAAYDSSNLHKAQEYLAMFKGNERELLENLVRRFGPEPVVGGMSSRSSFGSLTPRSHSAQSFCPKSPGEGELDGAGDPPSAYQMDNPYRERLVAFYRRYNPGKLASIDETLRKYAGQEAFLMDQLVRKYGPEPISSPQLSPQGCSANAGRAATNGNSPIAPSQPSAFEEAHPASASAPAAPLRERIVAMYTVYAADQVASLDKTLELYDGDEQALLDALVGAYGPEPTSDQVEDARKRVMDGPSKSNRKRSQSLLDQTRERVSSLLRAHDPDAITTIDHLLSENAGREEELVNELVAKYETGSRHADPHEDSVATLTLGQIRQQIAEKARAENRAFLQRLDEGGGTAEELPQLAPTVSETIPDQEEDHRRSSSVAAVLPEESPMSSPQRAKNRQVMSVSPAILPSEAGVGHLYAIEKKLHEALDATERILCRNEILHEENVRLTIAHRTLQQQCDEEVRAVKNQLDLFQSNASRQQHEFSLERVQLKMQEEGAVLKLKQETQEERAKYITTHLETLAEKKQLEQLLMETKSALAQSDSTSRSLEMRIKRRDKELDDARAEVKFLTIQLDKSNCEDAATQTDQLLGSSSPRLDRRMSSLQRLDLGALGQPPSASPPSHDTNDIGQLRATCEELERELEVMKAKHREAIEECENATKFILILKNKRKKLEERVAHLELRELAIPDSPPSHTEVECRRLEAEVAALQDQLAGADAQNRRSKREIAELRSLLSLHMAGSTPRSGKKRMC